MNFINWSNQHQQKIILGKQISYIDTGKSNKKTILIIHGYGSSSFDYHKIINSLKEDYRVLIPDLVGFGLSSKPTKSYFSIVNQAEILHQLLVTLEIKDISIVAQGFGSSVMAELLHIININTINIKIDTIFLLSTSLYLEICFDAKKQNEFSKIVSSIFLKMASSYGLFKKYILESISNKNSISEEELQTSWKLLNYNDGSKTFDFANYWSIEIKNSSLRLLKVLKNLNTKNYLILGKVNNFEEYLDLENTKKLLKIKETFIIEDCGYFVTLEKPQEFITILKKKMIND